MVSTYVTLKRSGSNLSGLCPFHNEKTPSFTLFADDHFYCFGCGAGGDVITFVMRAENLEYGEAIEYLAKRAGLDLPKNEYQHERGVRRERLADMNRDAARFFHARLMSDNSALEYLTNRGLEPAIIRHFGLGYSPNEFGALLGYMRGLGYTIEELTAGFLCGISRKNGKPYDYFRGRIMFPIIDTQGTVIAFGGRVIDGSMPKYLNSSDTPIFKKSRNLFALNFAKQSCAERLILCEGYMDVIALHAAGFTNAVATLGTAITSEHARIMARCTKSVIISYDSDEAGQRAADKAFRLLGEVGLEARVLRMNGAKDPDEYIKKYGSDKFRELLDGSVSRFEFRYAAVTRELDFDSYEDKIRAAKELCDFVASVPSAIEREVYIRQISERLSLPLEGLKKEADAIYRKSRRNAQSEEKRRIQLSAAGYGDRVNPDYAKNVAGAGAEEAILGMLMLSPELAESDAELCADDFATEFNRRVFEHLTTPDSDINEQFAPEEIGRITRMKVRREMLTDNGEDVFRDCVERLRASKVVSGDDAASIEDIIRSKQSARDSKA